MNSCTIQVQSHLKSTFKQISRAPSIESLTKRLAGKLVAFLQTVSQNEMEINSDVQLQGMNKGEKKIAIVTNNSWP